MLRCFQLRSDVMNSQPGVSSTRDLQQVDLICSWKKSLIKLIMIVSFAVKKNMSIRS